MSSNDPFLAEAEAVLVQSWRDSRASVAAKVSAAVKYIDLKSPVRVLPDVATLSDADAEQLLSDLADRYIQRGWFPESFDEAIRQWCMMVDPSPLDEPEPGWWRASLGAANGAEATDPPPEPSTPLRRRLCAPEDDPVDAPRPKRSSKDRVRLHDRAETDPDGRATGEPKREPIGPISNPVETSSELETSMPKHPVSKPGECLIDLKYPLTVMVRPEGAIHLKAGVQAINEEFARSHYVLRRLILDQPAP